MFRIFFREGATHGYLTIRQLLVFEVSTIMKKCLSDDILFQRVSRLFKYGAKDDRVLGHLKFIRRVVLPRDLVHG